jgi:hypothetical protein
MSYRVAGIVGNTKGRDHIPWRIFNGGPRTRGLYSNFLANPIGAGYVTGSFDNAEIFPQQFDLAHIMMMTLRVKSWKLNGTVSYNLFSPFTASAPTLTCTFTDYPVKWRKKVPYPFDTTGAEPTKEWEMIDGPPRSVHELGTSGEVIPPVYDPAGQNDGGGPVPDTLYSENGILGALPPGSTRSPSGEASTSPTPQSYMQAGQGFQHGISESGAGASALFSISSAGTVTLGATGYSSSVGIACDLLSWEPPPIALGEYPQDQVLFDTTSKKFSPSIYLSLGLAPYFTDGGGHFANLVEFSTLAQNAGIPSGTVWTPTPNRVEHYPDTSIGTFAILDAPTMPVYINRHVAFDLAGVPVAVAASSGFTSSLLLTASEYWPYQNSLGLPVYDTATGAQLVDPFS